MLVNFMMEAGWSSRWSKDQLKTLLLNQFKAFWRLDTGLERTKLVEIEPAIQAPHAMIISGLRRVGKTTFLAQIAHRLGQDSLYYVNFEADYFLGFQTTDTSQLYQILLETFGERKIFILDGVQNFPTWELFVRRFMDLGFKFYLADSLIPLPGRELGTHLTGRYVSVELFPFSFGEFIQFQHEARPDLQRQTAGDKALLKNLLEIYLRSGGLPEALKYPESPFLRDLYNAILYRDIAAHHHLKKITALRKFAFYLLSNPARPISLDQIRQQYPLATAKTLQAYLSYLENNWLVLALDVFADPVSRQSFKQKKIYCIDTGLAIAIGSSPDPGKLLENLVFLALRRQTKELLACALPGSSYAGFYLPEKRQLIQISTDWGSSTTSKREMQALSTTLKKVRVESALILSAAEQQSFELDGMQVEVHGIAEWLASQ